MLATYRDHTGAADRRAGEAGGVELDTSVAMIEKTYSKHIADHGDEPMRRVVFDTEACGWQRGAAGASIKDGLLSARISSNKT